MSVNYAQTDAARLVDNHLEAVYRYARRLAASVADAEDLTQQVFLTAAERCDQLREPDRARAWLFAILRTHFLRDRRRWLPATATACGYDLSTVPDEPDRAVIDADGLQQALAELTEMHRLILAMFYYEHKSYREIATDLDLPIGTVMSRLARAKAQLRARLFEQ